MKIIKYIIGILAILIIGFGLGWFFNDMADFAKGVTNDAKRNGHLNEQNSDSIFTIDLINQKTNNIDNVFHNLTGIYEYIYEHNTDDLIENHYLEFNEGKVFYYGTSDDFDEAREGYLPGFFYTKINDFKASNNSIEFSLTVNDSAFFKNPITPMYQTNGSDPWGIGIRYKTRLYVGQITGDTILITTKDFEQRLFKKK